MEDVLSAEGAAVTNLARKSVSPKPQPARAMAAEAPARGPNTAVALPLVFAAALAAMSLLPSIRANTTQSASVLGAAAFIAACTALFFVIAGPRARSLDLTLDIREQHWVQACAHTSIYIYWGWYWRQVYDAAPLIIAQLLFAYGVDMLTSFARRGSYRLGFGPFPIIFSTNLFLWFKPDWFYLQFVMVTVGFLAKEFITWQKEGRRSHIFNPSSFTLGLFSLGLLLTGSTNITWSAEIAQTFASPPYIWLWIFVASLPGQYLFGVASMTVAAVATAVAFGLGYHAVFGTYYFVDGFVPAAVFLGMHLLFTDPSTAPRTELGRIVFGMMYALSVIVLFGILSELGLPTQYDKLMAVPLLNLSIRAIDATVRSTPWLQRIDPARLGPTLAPRQRNLMWIAIWAVVFAIFSDPTDSYRPRRWLPLWEQACTENGRNACDVVSRLEAQYCRQGSGWACNELGILLQSGRGRPLMPPREAFDRACLLGVQAGCSNAAASAASIALPPNGWARSTPQLADYPFLLQEGRGPLTALTPDALYAEACHQGWTDGCQRLEALRSSAPAPR